MPPVHPAADKFPMMSDADLAALAEDIKQHGQRVPIQMIDGAILDGRNRWRACEIASVAPVTQNWTGQGSPAGYVLSINLRRRHLSPEQRAAIAAEFEEMFRQEARLRQAAAGGDKRPLGAETTPSAPATPRDESGRALAQAAAAAGASLDSAKKIKAAAKIDPELLTMARDGQVKVAEATRLAAMPAPQREEAKAQIRGGAKPATVAPPVRREPVPARPTPPAAPRPKKQPPEPEFTPAAEAIRASAAIQQVISAWPEQFWPTLAAIFRNAAERITR